MADLSQVDYRNTPSFGDAALPETSIGYDRPLSAVDHPISPQLNAQHQMTPEKAALELEQPQIAGFSPDLQRQLKWERERRGFG